MGPQIAAIKKFHNSISQHGNHEAALEAISAAPTRQISKIHETGTEEPEPDSSVTQFADEIKGGIQQHVEFLADDALEGRMTGSKGSKLAADYIAEHFSRLNLQPAGEEDGYFQTFEFRAGSKVIPDENNFHLTRKMEGSEEQLEFKVEQDFFTIFFLKQWCC